ncbi:hypothetical protein [Peribacillus simplex]|uniref:Uncharacterized protein n=1 Tax=Peribacillus simplex NBRC 15720 = DSM 1321 TaxID=1349754 RepID=A0A223EC65_9BACI|nr:hypothetical protein [Peribacillus simplex]ASS92828.1 hypothetical protein BS1321_01845 [Peribacillus simplex NBRC 15720 = DSM 1321]MEC1400610.1 hypothetical protein [Peribacillus simplex]MED3983575.1 hypothetical protein [Peribacillus simplex]MED4096752.1 hypothetical protein [Peribacillus simplex]
MKMVRKSNTVLVLFSGVIDSTAGEAFPSYKGYTVEPARMYKTAYTKIGKDIELIFNNFYKFNWDMYEPQKRLYFLSVVI